MFPTSGTFSTGVAALKGFPHVPGDESTGDLAYRFSIVLAERVTVHMHGLVEYSSKHRQAESSLRI